MGDDRWRQIKEIFHEAADLAPAERAAFLRRACDGDEELQREVESLLVADAPQDTFLKAAVAQAAGRLPSEPDESAGLIGKRIGPYSITRLIGKGGMGSVYCAVRDDDIRMQVAVKLLARGTETEAALGRFRSERRILAGLQHPNIARLLDAGATEDGLPYFVMEYVDGRPLLDYAAPLSVRQRLELFRSVCSAVQYAHQNLVVHRDLKPGNILVTADGTPKLLDFGIAKLLDPESAGSTLTLTGIGVRLMTPNYASPEQVCGEPATTATDIYSLGVILYELLTGRRPHHIETSSPTAIERAICLEEPKKPSAMNARLDHDLDNIVLLALRKEAQRRYASVEQFSEDIRRYLEGRPVRARKDTLGYRANRFIRRNKIGFVVATLAVLGVLTGVAAVDRQARRAEYRFQQVRKLANTVLFDLNSEIESLAGSTKARELLVKTSLAYLDSLAAEVSGDPSLQLELAAAYEKVGDVQGNARFSNLGHPEDSVKSYGKALAIAQKLGSARPALELLARCYAKLGTVQFSGLGRSSEAHQNLRLATEIADSIPTKTGEPAYRVRAEVYGFLGDIDEVTDAQRAAQPLRRSLEIAREWASAQPSDESRYFLAIALGRSSDVLWQTGDLARSLDGYHASLRILEQLLTHQPENAVWLRDRGTAWERVGIVTGHPQYFNLGDPRSATNWLRQCVADHERLLAADPNNLRASFDLSEAMAEFAAVHREFDPKRAEQLYRHSLTLSSSFLNSNPQDREALSAQAFNRVGFAWVLRRLDKRADAMAELRRVVEILEGLATRDPADMDVRQNLGMALHTRAAHQLGTGNASGAEKDLERSRALLEPLYQQNPRKLTLLRDLADCYQGFGNLSASRSNWKQAQTWYQKSLDLWELWKQVGVSSVYDHQRRDVATRLVALAAKNSTKKNSSSR
jgi:tetratricopeptide (TPR) repeat protein